MMQAGGRGSHYSRCIEGGYGARRMWRWLQSSGHASTQTRAEDLGGQGNLGYRNYRCAVSLGVQEG